jgi:hypothetical protein
MLALAGYGLAQAAGIAQSPGFDERIAAPAAKDAAEFKSQARDFVKKHRELRAANPAESVTDVSLWRQQFDLNWQIERAINERRPPGDLESLGFERRDDGSFNIDTREHPEWRDESHRIASLFNSGFREGLLEALLERGFRPEDVVAVDAYIAAHDVKKSVRETKSQVAHDFRRVVRKLDDAKRPVPDSMVVAYWYQSRLAQSEAYRTWSEGLLKVLDAQRVRVLLSYLSEMDSYAVVTPESSSEGIAGTLAAVRSPDFEKLLSTEGDAP